MLRLLSRPAILTAIDAFLIVGSYTGAVWSSFEVGPGIFLLYDGGLVSIAVIAAIFIAALHLQMFYAPSRLRSRTEIAIGLSTATGIVFIVQAALQYFRQPLAVPLNVTLLGSVLTYLLLFAWRILYFRMAGPSLGAQRVLLVGATPLMREIARRIASRPEFCMSVLGYLDEQQEPGTQLENARVLARLDALPEIWQALKPDRVIADLGEHPLPADLVKRMMAAGMVVERPAALYERLFSRIPVSHLPPSTLLFSDDEKPAPARIALQSVYNNLVALAVLAITCPLMALTALAVKVTSRGPLWVRQSIMGWEMIPFTLHKFRTTRARRTAEGEIQVPTLLGGWLTRLRLDRLPQFLSVLRGEMSLVGPQLQDTEAAKALCESLPGYRLRFAVKPGLVSLGRIKATVPRNPAAELEYDLYYVRHLSVALDCRVLFRGVILQLRRWLGAEA